MSKLRAYTPVAHSSEEAEQLPLRQHNRIRPLCYGLLGTIGLLLLGWACFVLGRLSMTVEQCGRKLSTWSPALDVVEYQRMTFDGEFLAPSKYRGAPSKQLDEAWDKITLGGTRNMRIDASDLSRLNKTKNDKTEFIYKDGKDGIAVVMLEVFHHLHCLNELRKQTWPAHYGVHDDAKMEKLNRAHIDHCIEMLRIAIMCESDVTPITLYVPDYQDDPTPDFSTMHTCRNFDRILEYVHENTMDYSLAD